MTDTPIDMPEDAGVTDDEHTQSWQAAREIDRRRAPRNAREKLARDPGAVAGGDFDVVVVGGGAFGAWAAYDAAQRGLSVALFERDDFGAGVSAGALRMAHTGMGGFVRSPKALRQRAIERRGLMGVAPHLVQPKTVLAPRYGKGGHAASAAGVGHAVLSSLATARVGRGLHDRERRDGWPGVTWAGRVRRLLPGVPRHRLMGAESRPGLQIMCPERLVLAVVQSAVCRGAQVLNRAEVDGLIFDGDAVTGVTVSDRYTGEHFSVNSRVVINATGPDAGDLLLRGNRPIELPAVTGTHALALRTPRRLVEEGRVLALPGPAQGRELVVTSTLDGGSLIGPWALPEGVEPTPEAREAGAAACVRAVNLVLPSWYLRAEDVQCVSTLWLPDADPEGRAGQWIDHDQRDGVAGLMSLVGNRYEAAHVVAAHAVDQLMEKMDLPEAPSRTTWVPLVGGDLPTVRALSAELAAAASGLLDEAVLKGVQCRQGADGPWLVQAAIKAGESKVVQGARVLVAELVYAMECEGALGLDDAVLRRVGIDGWRDCSDQVLAAVAQAVGEALGWTDAQCRNELDRLRQAMASHVLDEPSVDDDLDEPWGGVDIAV